MKTFNRYDVLRFGMDNSIRIAVWDFERKEIDNRKRDVVDKL